MTTLRPRMDLPDELAEKASCPVCGGFILNTVHLAGAPDQVACDYCKAIFEIAEDGLHGRLIKLPQMMNTYQNDVLNVWMTGIEMRRFADECIKNSSKNSFIPNNKPYQIPETKNEWNSHSIGFLDHAEHPEGGNGQDSESNKPLDSHHHIQINLNDAANQSRSNNDAEENMPRINRIRQLRQQRLRNQKFRLWMGIAIIIVLFVTLLVWAFDSGPLRRPTPTPEPQLSLPVQAIPDQATPSNEKVLTDIPLSMSQEGLDYFSGLWRLRGNYSQKAVELATIRPPTEIEKAASTILEAYRQAGEVEDKLNACLSEEDSQSICEKEKKDLLTTQDNLSKAYIKECTVFKEYYQKYNETWPNPDICQGH